LNFFVLMVLNLFFPKFPVFFQDSGSKFSFFPKKKFVPLEHPRIHHPSNFFCPSPICGDKSSLCISIGREKKKKKNLKRIDSSYSYNVISLKVNRYIFNILNVRKIHRFARSVKFRYEKFPRNIHYCIYRICDTFF